MAQWFNTSSAVPEWKTFINTFEELKQQQIIKPQQLQFGLEPHQIPCLQKIPLFLNNVTLILNEVKSYNNQMTDFVRNHAPLLIKQAIRMILEVPQPNDTLERKNKYPLQSLEFIQGLMYLPNIFNINLLKEQLYVFYCKAIFHYFQLNLVKMQQKQHHQDYQNAIYKNYFFRLFQLPYAVVQCETRIGVNYASITMSVASSASMGPKKQSFLQCLISTLQKNSQLLDMIISNISCESLLNCMSKILMTNGMYNYPFAVKEQALRRLFDTKKKYIELLSNFMNSKIAQKQFTLIKEEVQLQIQNILELQFNIVNRSGAIYDGIKLFEMIGNLDNVKDVVYLASVNIVWTNRNPSNQSLIPPFIEQHLTELLLSIAHKDTQLYKSSSPTMQLQPKINLKEINMAIQPLLLSLKELLSEKFTKVQIKHLNLVKILYVMILNRQKYQVLQTMIIKQSILCILVDICKKYNQMDIIINAVMDIFKSIFKSEVNLLILPLNAPNLQEFKNRNDLIEQKLTAEAFKAGDLILSVIKNMKSHKDPMFGHFFKLAKVIKQFSRNFFSTIQSSTSMQMSSSSSLQIQSSVNLNMLLQPLYRNEFIKIKCKQWQDFYMANFIQLENNYLRDLGKFEEFDNTPPQPETQFTIVKFCQQKDLTQSQATHNKEQIDATMKNSIEILSLKKKQKQAAQNARTCLNFKKDKGNSLTQNTNTQTETTKTQSAYKPISAQLITKQEIQITSEPIKIQFKRKKTQNLEEIQNDSATEQTSPEEGEESFKKFMKKKIDEITTQNRENLRKKSKTPTKFKSADDKTPPKMKRWGISQPEQQSKNVPKQLTSVKHKSQTQLQNNKNSRNLSADEKIERLKQNILQKKPLPIRIIRVTKLPPVYKQRDLDPEDRDSRLMAWIRG